MKPRILILHTGGTIGMEATPDGLQPMARFGRLLKQWQHEADSMLSMPDFDVIEFDTLFDSADLTPVHWLRIAGELVHHWDVYDGFIVLHGTDTMAWTASALSFMLRGMDKPVVLTGSQIPFAAPRSDAQENFQMALALAADQRIHEVGICFGRKFLRGNRASKIATSRFDAFASSNYPPLAEAETGIVVHGEHLLQAQEKAFFIPGRIDSEAVAALTIYPGISARMIEAVLSAPGIRGLVLRSYGVGNMPQVDKRFVAAMGDGVARGVILVNTTQCLIGAVAPDTYATGAAFARIGVISGNDMTFEAACAKLHILIARGLLPEEIHRQMVLPHCGEMMQVGDDRM